MVRKALAEMTDAEVRCPVLVKAQLSLDGGNSPCSIVPGEPSEV